MRKKRLTAIKLQQQAIRLFDQHGYSKTSVEQIAEAADVSVSTFFRYFETKEAVMMYSPYNHLVIDTFQRQPKQLSTVLALQRSITVTFQQLPPDATAYEARRFACIQNDRALRSAVTAALAVSQPKITEWLMQHKGNKEDASILAGILVGIGAAIFMSDSPLSYMERFNEALTKLSDGSILND